ncbi:hypothetical protein MPSEU_000223800 [Mayamaea pseudoterrestris]|nr:hypothetical protein MPSEU_000223800 [Mayamaea pseudoterrestris]
MSSISEAASRLLGDAWTKPSDRSSTETALTSTSTTASSFASANDNGPEENDYWNDDDWVPVNKNGTQRSPNQIRNEFQRYLDKCGMTQTTILSRIGVNSNSFRKFMNPKTYKNPWSAVENGTYWAAARLLEEERMKPKASSATGTKRKANDSAGGAEAKKSKAQAKSDAMALMQRIMAVENVNERAVYDSCPEVIKKIKTFLEMDGVTKSDFCSYCLDVQPAQLNKFLMTKQQDGAGQAVYHLAWTFFEKKRLLDGEPKSKARIKNESEHPRGFDLARPRTHMWVYVGANERLF